MRRLLLALLLVVALLAVDARGSGSAPSPSAEAPRLGPDARVHLVSGLSVPVPAGWHLSQRLLRALDGLVVTRRSGE